VRGGGVPLVRLLRLDQLAVRDVLLPRAAPRRGLLRRLRLVPRRRLRELRLAPLARAEIFAGELLQAARAAPGVVVAQARGEGGAHAVRVVQVVLAAVLLLLRAPRG
jgi:hypothetical protein